MALFGGHLSQQDKINFTRHLAIIIKAGLPLLEGLKIIRRQTGSTFLLKVIDQLIIDVNNGQSLARGLKRYEKIFGVFFINIVEVGENSGTLADNLLYLAEEMKKSKALRGKVKAAMIYPAILFVMTVVVSSFLTFFIFPKLLSVFDNLNTELPWSTQILIGTLGFLKSYLVYIVIGSVLLFILFRFALRLPKVKFAFDRTVLSIPVVAPLAINTSMANFSRILALLLKSGIKIVEAVIIVSDTFDNAVYRTKFKQAAEEIRSGGSLAEFLGKDRAIFPTILAAMVEVGESTGNLDENLFYLSDYYTEEVDNSLKNLTALIEPLIIMIMGLVVGFVALSIITPIYSITQSISR